MKSRKEAYRDYIENIFEEDSLYDIIDSLREGDSPREELPFDIYGDGGSFTDKNQQRFGRSGNNIPSGGLDGDPTTDDDDFGSGNDPFDGGGLGGSDFDAAKDEFYCAEVRVRDITLIGIRDAGRLNPDEYSDSEVGGRTRTLDVRGGPGGGTAPVVQNTGTALSVTNLLAGGITSISTNYQIRHVQTQQVVDVFGPMEDCSVCPFATENNEITIKFFDEFGSELPKLADLFNGAGAYAYHEFCKDLPLGDEGLGGTLDPDGTGGGDTDDIDVGGTGIGNILDLLDIAQQPFTVVITRERREQRCMLQSEIKSIFSPASQAGENEDPAKPTIDVVHGSTQGMDNRVVFTMFMALMKCLCEIFKTNNTSGGTDAGRITSPSQRACVDAMIDNLNEAAILHNQFAVNWSNAMNNGVFENIDMDAVRAQLSLYDNRKAFDQCIEDAANNFDDYAGIPDQRWGAVAKCIRKMWTTFLTDRFQDADGGSLCPCYPDSDVPEGGSVVG
jgi:hypothetical protein